MPLIRYMLRFSRAPPTAFLGTAGLLAGGILSAHQRPSHCTAAGSAAYWDAKLAAAGAGGPPPAAAGRLATARDLLEPTAATKTPGVDTSKLRREVPAGRQPVVLVACGSFSPPTYMHLRIFEEARTALHATGQYAVVGGYLSPVHARYGKATLAPMHDRINMTKLAVADSEWLVADEFECRQDGWTKTAQVLDGFAAALKGQPVAAAGEPAAPTKVMLLCGGDLVESFTIVKSDGQPLWALADRVQILQNGIACLERAGTDLPAVIAADPLLARYAHNIIVIRPSVVINISSSAVRDLLIGRPFGSAKYMMPQNVIEYIGTHQLQALPAWQPKPKGFKVGGGGR